MIVWLTALGHMIRDGFPALGSTFAARLAGAAVIGLGAWAMTDWAMAGALALAVLIGFYTDMQHGEANKGAWRAGIISGTSSLAPLALMSAILVHPAMLTLIAFGVAKPPIWKAACAVEPLRWRSSVPEWAEPIFEPTRVAAVIWGALVGVIVFTVAMLGD